MAKDINYAWPVTVLLHDDFLQLEKCINENRALFESKEIVIFGAGIRGSLFGNLLRKLGIDKFTFVDNNSEKWEGYMDFPCHTIATPTSLLENVESKIVLVSIENAGTIKAQLHSYGFVENKNLFFIQTEIYEKYVKEVQRSYTNDLLVMGDCGFSQISLQDTKHEPLVSMLENAFSKENIKILGMHGMGMRSFYHIFKLLLQRGQVPKTFILMANFEVFTKMHYLLPRTQHAPLFSLLQKNLEMDDKEFCDYVAITAERASKIYGESVQYDKENEESNARLVIKMNYMYKLSEKTEDSVYFMKIMQLAKKYHVCLIPFIPPANYEFATQLHSNFEERYNANLALLTSWIDAMGFNYIDMSYSLRSDCFADIKTIDETCNYAGRVTILERILQTLSI